MIAASAVAVPSQNLQNMALFVPKPKTQSAAPAKPGPVPGCVARPLDFRHRWPGHRQPDVHKYWDGSAWHPSQTGWEHLVVCSNTQDDRAERSGRLESGNCWRTQLRSSGGICFSLPNHRRGSCRLPGTDNSMFHKYFDGSAWHPSTTDWEPIGGTFTVP
jgi:hypothetical protein